MLALVGPGFVGGMGAGRCAWKPTLHPVDALVETIGRWVCRPSITEIDDLVAFIASLTSPTYKEQGATELARQRALSRTNRPQRDTARAFGPKPQQPAPPK